MSEPKTIMAIGGHIGDMELTCGGVLATMALKGCKIITVALTAGERGNRSGIPQAESRGGPRLCRTSRRDQRCLGLSGLRASGE